MRLQIIDPPDNQVAGGWIDVEEIGAGLDLADAGHLATIDLGDGRARQALRQCAHGLSIPVGDGTGANGGRRPCIGEARQAAQGQPKDGQQAQNGFCVGHLSSFLVNCG